MGEAAVDTDAMREAAEQACALMKALSNPDRLLLLCELGNGERNVGELQEAVGIVQPTLSQQLAVLREEQLVETRREGKNIYYRVASAQAQAVLQVLYAQFCARPTRAGRSRR
ncbi:MAG TPA: metalloregulator ArsR/SmtB family transcription factor [Ramlibacter sp.]|jgi:Predicted transcriptional regulators|nr:metalloregulator ArsR/SmtB family transcription factor [Ramlibacter sp.]